MRSIAYPGEKIIWTFTISRECNLTAWQRFENCFGGL